MGDVSDIVPTIVIHGGAWAIPDDLAAASIDGVKMAASVGYHVLQNGGSAMDAVTEAVTSLENDPAFDAGTGSVLNADGHIEMDAVIMEGKHLNTGAVACVQNIRNPVKLARLVMVKTDHVLLVGQGADAFARDMEVPTVPTSELVTKEARKDYEKYVKFKRAVNVHFRRGGCDTVGAVALDREGNLASATSTGGITAKRAGRVGDSPLVGCGAYCDNYIGAISCTGHGEAIIKVCLAKHVILLMEQGNSAQEAIEQGLAYMARRVHHGHGGAVVVSNQSKIGVQFTTERMAWSSAQNGVLHYGLDHGDSCEEPIQKLS